MKDLEHAVNTLRFLILKFGHNSPHTTSLKNAIKIAFGQNGTLAIQRLINELTQVSNSPAAPMRTLLASGASRASVPEERHDARGIKDGAKKKSGRKSEAARRKVVAQEHAEPATRSLRRAQKGVADEIAKTHDQHTLIEGWPVEE